MKTRQHRIAFWSAAFIAAMLASGCGAPTAANDKEQVEVKTASTPVPDATPAAAAAAAPEGATAAVSAEGGAVPESAPPPTPRSSRVSPDLPESVNKVVQLVEGGAGEEIVRAYVGGSSDAYDLSLEQILYLRDIGIGDGIIAAMMRRGSELRDQQAESGVLQSNIVAAAEQIRQNLGQNAAPGTAADPATPEGGPAPPPPVPGQASIQGEPAAPAMPAVATAPSPADAPQEVRQFYAPLSPYGTWYQTASYGWVWQPTVVVVNQGWTPYQQGGNWVWTDCGWYWHSEYSWGWAPFHYGRWATHPGIGWCWVPDTVWGPSWVTWRHSDGFVGWAPLPPRCGWSPGIGLVWHGAGVHAGFSFGLASHCYTFVPRHAFCHRNLAFHSVRGDHHRTAYQGSVTVNNIIKGNNNTIVNNGIGYDNIAKNVRGEVPKARVQSLPSDSKQTLRADRMERGKDGMVVYRPQPVEAAGGRPTSHISPEVRPASAFATGSPSRPAPGRSPGGVSRTGSGSGPGIAASPAAGKPVDSRGAMTSGRPQSTVPAPATARPGSPERPTANSVTRTPSRAPSSAAGAKPIDARSGSVGSSPESMGGGSPGAAPRREITPVPLSDPSRNIPARPTAPANRGTPVERGSTTQPYSVPTRPTATPTAPGAAPRNPYATPQAPAGRAPTADERRGAGSSSSPGYSVPQSAPGRTPTYNGAAPSVSTPRPSYSAPAPAMSAPRPSYSAPAPAMSAPRPSYSAPAPAMSAPRPSYSAPAPSAPPASGGGSQPSRGGSDGSGSGRGGSGSRGGSRTQVD